MKAAIDLTTIRPDNLTDDIIRKYKGSVIDTTGWTINDFDSLNVGQRWCASCSCCNGPISSCKNYIVKEWGAEQWQEYYKSNRKEDNKDSKSNSDLSAKKILKTGTGKRGKIRTTREKLDESEHAEVLNKFDTLGLGAVVLAKEYNVQPQYMSLFLKANGRVVKRGKKSSKIETINLGGENIKEAITVS
jgi:hypothetical protein